MVVTPTGRRTIGVLLLLVPLIPHGAAWGSGPKIVPSPCTIHYPSDAQVKWECRRLRKGETLESLFGDRWTDIARFNRIDRRHAHPGIAIKVPKRLEDIAYFTPMPAVYRPAEFQEKFILIDLSEQFLGAYEYGTLAFSAPITSGEEGLETPGGRFHITAAHRRHRSDLYVIEDTKVPYPMNYALRFYIDRQGVSYWIHGRDIPGAPLSHGCIGLYDEVMQREYYGIPRLPELRDAARLYEWVTGPLSKEVRFLDPTHGPMVRIVGRAPGTGPAAQEHAGKERNVRQVHGKQQKQRR